MADLSETAATLGTWESRGGLWRAVLTRNHAGAYYLAEMKRGRPVGGMSRPAGFFADDAAALAWARETVPQCFDVQMTER